MNPAVENILIIQHFLLSNRHLQSETKLLLLLQKLENMEISKKYLQETTIGRTVDYIKWTSKSKEVRDLASNIINGWRKMLYERANVNAAAATTTAIDPEAGQDGKGNICSEPKSQIKKEIKGIDEKSTELKFNNFKTKPHEGCEIHYSQEKGHSAVTMQEYAFKPTATTTKRKSFVIRSTRSSSTLPTKQETKCNIDGLEFENSKRKSQEGCQTIIAAKKQITTTKSTHLKELPKETTIQEEDLEKKVENHINQLELDCCQKKEEILSIKNTLSDPYLKSETEVLESLRKLQKLVDSKQILQETMIGRTVNSIKKTCKSNKIRHLALILIMEWRKLVDKWLELEASATTGENTKNNEIELQKHVSFFSVPISDKQEKQHDENLILLKIEGSKRKLHEDYQEAENAKKQRSVKFFDFHKLLEKKNAIQDKAPDTRPQIQYQPRPYRRKIRVNMRMRP